MAQGQKKMENKSIDFTYWLIDTVMVYGIVYDVYMNELEETIYIARQDY